MLYFALITCAVLVFILVVLYPYFLIKPKSYFDEMASLDYQEQKNILLIQMKQLDDDLLADKITEDDYQLIAIPLKRKLLSLSKEEKLQSK